MSDRDLYGEEYYQTSFGGIPYNRDSLNGHWPRFFQNIAQHVFSELKPGRVLDAGCAKGFLVEALRDLNVPTYGFDMSGHAIGEVRRDIGPFCRTGSVDDESMYDGWYDLITCIEVLEHVTMEVAIDAIRLMTSHTDTVVFSSSPTDFEEPTHINVNPTTRWVEEFSRNGFVQVDMQWTREVIAPHALVFATPSRAVLLMTDNLIQQSATSDDVQVATENVMVHLEEKFSSLASSLNLNTESLLSLKRDISGLHAITQAVSNSIERTTNEDELRVQLSAFQAEVERLSAERDRLGASLHHSDSISAHHASKLVAIESGRTYRVMKKLWTLRDRLLPPGTLRRKTYHGILGGQAPDRIAASANVVPSSSYTEWWTNSFQSWLAENTPTREALSIQREAYRKFDHTPVISVVTPVYRVSPAILRETINSVEAQTYPFWELILVFDQYENGELKGLLSEKCLADKRIRCFELESNDGISDATNACLTEATGEYIALLDHDDVITPDALFEVVKTLNDFPDADFVYSDKDQITGDGATRLNPLFKTEFSWVSMLSANYPTHFCVIRHSMIKEIGGFDPNTDGAQDWDIFLKVSLRARRIVHLPKVLYHWRIIESSVASGLSAKPYVISAQRYALSAYLEKRGIEAEVRIAPNSSIRVYWPRSHEKVTAIVFHSKEADLATLEITLRSISRQNLLPDKVFVVSDSLTQGTIESVASGFQHSFDISVARNDSLFTAMEDVLYQCNTELCFVVFSGCKLGNDDCLYEMRGWLMSTGSPFSSGQLLSEDRKILNSGYVVRPDGRLIDVYGGMDEGAYSSYGSSQWYREYRAVSESVFLASTEHLRRGFRVAREYTTELKPALLLAQLLVTREGITAVYSPYAKIYQVTNADAVQIHAFSVNVIGMEDRAYNPNVWDWNQTSFNPYSVPEPKSEIPSTWSAYTSDAIILASIYDFDDSDLENNTKALRQIPSIHPETALWFLPPFNSAYYGGIHTILRFAEHLNSAFGIANTFAIVGVKNTDSVMMAIYDAVPSLIGSKVLGIHADESLARIESHDIGFCTLWTTAYSLLKFNRVKRKLYFLQDYEPLFYPAGATSAQVEATYRFGFDAICNTQSLQQSYVAYGGSAKYFTPSVNGQVFYRPLHDVREQTHGERYKIFLYGRPGNPRNAFELAIPALKKVKNTLGDKVEILSAGAEWDPRSYGLDGVVTHLGMLPYEKTGDLYRQCHLGLTMMLTRHPSYLPFELMATGCVVVACSNKWNNWMLEDGINALIAEPSASSIANRIISIIENKKKLIEIRQGGYDYIASLNTWQEEFARVSTFVLNGEQP